MTCHCQERSVKVDPLVVVSAFLVGLVFVLWVLAPVTVSNACYPDGTFTESTGLRLRAHGANICEPAP